MSSARLREDSQGPFHPLADFADRIGLNQSYLSAVEHGRNEVDVEVLLVISRKFGSSKCGGRATGL
jgi:transcriptional regulator with XRE-family HTH domain